MKHKTSYIKYLIYSIIIVVLSVYLLFIKKPSSENKKSDIKAEVYIPDIKQNLQEVSLGDTIKTRFVIYNTGKAPFVIIDSRKSCGCFDIEWDRKPVSRNDSTVINVMFYAKEEGGFIQKFTTFSNAVNSPHIFTIHGHVIK